jgi:LEA14-like dessication related protein
MKRALSLSLALALVLPGCAALQALLAGAFRQPSFTFKSVSLGEISLTGVTLNLTYTLANPNPVGLSLAEVDYALFVEGHQVVAGKPPKGLTIPAQGQVDLLFPASVKFAELAPVLQTFLEKDYAQYRAEGHLGVQTPVGVISFPLAHQDQFEVPKFPAVQLGSPRVTQLSFTGAILEIPLTVTNRNSFQLPVSGLSGALSIAGAVVGQVDTGDLGAMEGRAARQINLPVTVNFGSALAVANAIRVGSGDIGFNGQLRSGAASLPLSFHQNLTFRR